MSHQIIRRSHADLFDKYPPARAWYEMHTDKSSEAMEFGSAFHCWLLEPHKFNSQFAFSQYDNFSLKGASAEKAEFLEKGLTRLRKSDREKIQAMQSALLSTELDKAIFNNIPFNTVGEILAESVKEEKFTVKHPFLDVSLTCRPDLWYQNNDLILVSDLKTNELEASLFSLSKETKRAWTFQAEFYRMVFSIFFGVPYYLVNFLFLVVEKNPPYMTNVVGIGGNEPTGRVNAALERFIEARDGKKLKGHQQGYLTF